MVCCCCAVLAQMNQMMVNMNTTISLTAIDKRLMMKWASNCACASHTVPMACLDGDVVTWFWRFPSVLIQDPILAMLPIRPDQTRSIAIGPDQSWSGPINRNRARSNPIGPDREPDFGDAPNFGDDLSRSENRHFPKKCWKCQILILCGVSLTSPRSKVSDQETASRCLDQLKVEKRDQKKFDAQCRRWPINDKMTILTAAHNPKVPVETRGSDVTQHITFCSFWRSNRLYVILSLSLHLYFCYIQ
jgi:hypothetical protein